METYQSELLLIASRVLSYPSNANRVEVLDTVSEMDAPKDLQEKVENVIDSLYRIPLEELEEMYVSTFDLKEKVGLYLSAHEFGDSPKRGAALIKLQKIVNEAGYERMDGELADYIPMLFEFLAVASDNKHTERLIKRLACVIQRIADHLPEESPYYPMVHLLMEYVFEAPTKADMEKMDVNREEADLEELPYPIMYK